MDYLVSILGLQAEREWLVRVPVSVPARGAQRLVRRRQPDVVPDRPRQVALLRVARERHDVPLAARIGLGRGGIQPYPHGRFDGLADVRDAAALALHHATHPHVTFDEESLAHRRDRRLDAHADVVALVDVDQQVLAREKKKLADGKYGEPTEVATYTDLRRALDRDDIDVISVASPNHWHALQAVWACQAGKDVYLEKPVSHNVWEGGQIVKAARKYNRIVQTGTQCRSSHGIAQGIDTGGDGVPTEPMPHRQRTQEQEGQDSACGSSHELVLPQIRHQAGNASGHGTHSQRTQHKARHEGFTD